MNQQSFGQKTGPDTEAGSGAATASDAGADRQAVTGAKGRNGTEAVLGPFTIRDLAVFAATVILFIASLLPLFGGRYNLWNLNNLFFLGLGIVLPLAVSALFAARRLAPGTKIRIGSLSIDQFASVVASFAIAFFFLSVAGAYVPSLMVGLIGAVVLFAVTVLGRFLPYISPDFQDRAESPAHVVAREAAVPVRKPRVPKQPKVESGAADSRGPESASASQPGVGKLLGAAGGKLFGGAGAGSSAVQTGASHQPPATAAVPSAAASHSPATAAVPTAGVTAAGGPAASGPVSTAPEVSERAPEGDAGPPTQAADVVRPAPAPAAEETQFGDVPVRGGGADSSSAMAHHDGDAPAGSAARSTWEPPAATAVHQQVRAEEPIGATVDPASRSEESEEQPIHEAFWFAVAQHRTAFDPRTGAPAFVIEPGGWVLALEDRGHEFLVQHTDGRLGVLRDLSNIERG